MKQNQNITDLIRSVKEGKKINIISIIIQNPAIATQYQAVTGEILVDQLRQFREPFVDVLIQLIKPTFVLQAELLAAQTIPTDWEFLFSLIFMTKSNTEMQEFVRFFNQHHNYRVDNLINQICRTKIQRRIFTALTAGFRSEEKELRDVDVIRQLNECETSQDVEAIQDILIYILCSFSDSQIQIVLQNTDLMRFCTGEAAYLFRNLILRAKSELVKTLLNEAMLCQETIKIARISTMLVVLRGKFDFERELGPANFQEQTKTFSYEVMYQLWK